MGRWDGLVCRLSVVGDRGGAGRGVVSQSVNSPAMKERRKLGKEALLPGHRKEVKRSETGLMLARGMIIKCQSASMWCLLG